MEFKIDLKDTITATSILLTFITALTGLVISWRNSKKTIYINSITSSRIKWMDTVREDIAEFCGLTLHICLTQLTDIDKRQIIEKIDKLRFLLKLRLHSNDPLYKKVLAKIDLIPNLTDEKKINELEHELNNLVELTQVVLNIEWKWIKAESKFGELTKQQKDVILNKYESYRK